ncbi:hypothetical protein N431DRAFT_442121 [Stipitochalara longipes BDJ]|nr:hypothetical protein N431DRAFT_442121 [Stipitochalara longipes BDJ]
MPYPHVLTSLTPREAVADALSRALIAFDHNDAALLNTAFAADIKLSHPAGEMNQLSDLHKLLAHVGPMDSTHMISNLRVEVKDGADIASLTAYTLAQHSPPGRGKEPGGPKYMVAGEYAIDVVKEGKEGLWKIKSGVFTVIWGQGDASVMRPA